MPDGKKQRKMNNHNEEYISITKMALLRGITTETLRHYDRIGLLKPDYLDENRIRYYSVSKYEKLGTIKELQQIGMNLKEVSEYMECRTLCSSLDLVKRQKKMIEDRLTELKNIYQRTLDKLDFLSSISADSYQDEIVLKEFGERYYLAYDTPIYNETDLSYAVLHLEKTIHRQEKYLPIYATSRYGTLFDWADTTVPGKGDQLICFISSEKYNSDRIQKLPAGIYCCVRNRGDFWDRKKPVSRINQYLQDNHLIPGFNRIIENVIVDYTITDIITERLYEFQLLVHT